ncbi:hypothetical protein ACFWGG_30070, partial [Streptomyces roseolus]
MVYLVGHGLRGSDLAAQYGLVEDDPQAHVGTVEDLLARDACFDPGADHGRVGVEPLSQLNSTFSAVIGPPHIPQIGSESYDEWVPETLPPAVDLFFGVERLQLTEGEEPRLSSADKAARDDVWKKAVQANLDLFDGPVVACAGLEP